MHLLSAIFYVQIYKGLSFMKNDSRPPPGGFFNAKVYLI